MLLTGFILIAIVPYVVFGQTCPSTPIPPANCCGERCCKTGYARFENKCYRGTHATMVNWQEALNDCNQDGSTLATIDNSRQNEFVRSYIATGIPVTFADWVQVSMNHVRIGSFKSSTSNQWEWIDGTPMVYQNFVNDTRIFPNGPGETTAAMLPDYQPAAGSWNNIGAMVKVRRGVCSYRLF